MADGIIRIKNLSVMQGRELTLDQISIEIFQKDFLVLFGKDDSGKTTLLSVVMGFRRGTEGSVEVFGKSSNDLTVSVEQRIRFVPDDIIMEEMTAGDYLRFMGKGNVNYDKELEQRLREKYDINKERKLLDMTYQENKLTAVTAAICARPDLLILDEPYNFLSRPAMYDVLEELEKLNEEGTCVIVTAEKYEHLLGYGNKYLYLSEGSVKGEGVIAKEFYRMKAVTVPKGCVDKGGSTIGDMIGVHKDTVTYRYSGEVQKLFAILQATGCRDCMIEDISLEEELDSDFSRWEGKGLLHEKELHGNGEKDERTADAQS